MDNNPKPAPKRSTTTYTVGDMVDTYGQPTHRDGLENSDFPTEDDVQYDLDMREAARAALALAPDLGQEHEGEEEERDA